MAMTPVHEVHAAGASRPIRPGSAVARNDSLDTQRRPVREAVSVADVRRLPVPVTSIWDWRPGAACRDVDSTVFFHPEHERGPAKDSRERRAKRVCARCPVIEACRRYALAVQEPYGVWGGLTVAERAAILRHPRRLHLA